MLREMGLIRLWGMMLPSNRPSVQWIVDRRSGLTEVARTNYRRRHIEYAGAAGALPS